MECRDCTSNICKYIDNTLDIQTRERVESHLFACKDCERGWQQRAMLALWEKEGLSFEEIAASLDIPLEVIKSIIGQARNMMAFKEKGQNDGTKTMGYELGGNRHE